MKRQDLVFHETPELLTKDVVIFSKNRTHINPPLVIWPITNSGCYYNCVCDAVTLAVPEGTMRRATKVALTMEERGELEEIVCAGTSPQQVGEAFKGGLFDGRWTYELGDCATASHGSQRGNEVAQPFVGTALPGLLRDRPVRDRKSK
jgi:hypothetical protein